MSAAPEMKINALAPWFGNNRTLAETVGIELGKLDWCAVPFMGGAPELPFIRTRAGVAGDLHRHIINLARCIRDPDYKPLLIDRLDGILFHPDELSAAQRRCVQRDAEFSDSLFGTGKKFPDEPDVNWAADYFAACWMGMGGHAGKGTEFSQGLSIRYTSSGGDSARRLRSAIESLEAWHLVLVIWSFDCVDGFTIIDRIKDELGHGIYIDAPWPDAGEEYQFRFTEAQQRSLAKRLRRFKNVRIVIRYGDHPLIRELYPESDGWTWIRQVSVNQKGNEVVEVLIINGPRYSPITSEEGTV